MGYTVKAAFDVGVGIIKADESLRSKNEHQKYLLLPEGDELHDVPIFVDLPSGEWKNYTSSSAITNMRTVPEKFVGRQIEAQEVFELLLKNRMV
jgi:hypothetical protein